MDEPALPPMRSVNANVEDFPAADEGRGSYWTDAPGNEVPASARRAFVRLAAARFLAPRQPVTPPSARHQKRPRAIGHRHRLTPALDRAEDRPGGVTAAHGRHLTLGSSPTEDRSSGHGRVRRHETLDSAAATAKPSTVTSPEMSPPLRTASGIIESMSITSRAPAANPSTAALRFPETLSAIA
jgi:hypothetical protein